MSDTKICTKCGRELPATTLHFGVYRASSDGLNPMCKPCRSSYLKACKLINKTPPDKAQFTRKRSAEIYRLYYKTGCDSPAKERLFADFYGITTSTLNQIITEEEEKAMLKKWTDEMNAELLANASLPGTTNQSLAEMYGTSIANIAWRMSMLRKAAKETKTVIETAEPVTETPKAATVKADFDALFPVPAKPEVNKQIADLCETPDPKPKPDYTESPIETLREAEEFSESWYFTEPEEPPRIEPKPQPPVRVKTIFDEAHAALWSLESMAKRSGIATAYIHLDIGAPVISAECGCTEANVSINKKHPLTGTAIPTSGE